MKMNKIDGSTSISTDDYISKERHGLQLEGPSLKDWRQVMIDIAKTTQRADAKAAIEAEIDAMPVNSGHWAKWIWTLSLREKRKIKQKRLVTIPKSTKKKDRKNGERL